MKNKNLLFLLILAAALVVTSLFVYSKTAYLTNIPFVPAPKATVTIGGTKVVVDIPKSEEDRQKGLAGVENLPSNQGMLFPYTSFQKQVPQVMWMKGMLIPLDFIWITSGKVSTIHENVQPGNLKLHTPDEPADYVLEVNAGFVEKNDIKVGDNVIISI